MLMETNPRIGLPAYRFDMIFTSIIIDMVADW